MFIDSTILRVVLAHAMIFGDVASLWTLLLSRSIILIPRKLVQAITISGLKKLGSFKGNVYPGLYTETSLKFKQDSDIL